MKIGEIERVGEREIPGWTPQRQPAIEPMAPAPTPAPKREREREPA